MKILKLTLFKEYFDDILAGRKKIEYRTNKPYWQTRILDNGPFDEVEFVNGYGNHRPTMRVEFKETRVDPLTIEIHLGQITLMRNLTEEQESLFLNNGEFKIVIDK